MIARFHEVFGFDENDDPVQDLLDANNLKGTKSVVLKKESISELIEGEM